MGARRRPLSGEEVPTLATGSVLLHVVGSFAVFVQVEAFAFGFFRNTQPDDHVCNLEGDVGHHRSPDHRDADRFGLNQQLIHDWVGADFSRHPVSDQSRAAEVLVVKDTGQQRTQYAAQGVDTEDVQRIVCTEHFLQAVDAPEADQRASRSRMHRGCRRYRPPG